MKNQCLARTFQRERGLSLSLVPLSRSVCSWVMLGHWQRGTGAGEMVAGRWSTALLPHVLTPTGPSPDTTDGPTACMGMTVPRMSRWEQELEAVLPQT